MRSPGWKRISNGAPWARAPVAAERRMVARAIFMNVGRLGESIRIRGRGIMDSMEPDLAKIETLVRQLLVELGEDPEREGLKATPSRVARSLSFLTHGYRASLDEVINQALFTQDTSSMVIVKD